MSFKSISISESHGGQVGIITLHTPPANILTAAMMSELSEFFATDKHNTARKILVIKGSGEHFCFGASVEEHTSARVRDMLPGFHRMIGDIIAHPVATLAQVSGFCLGGGFELALACSFIFADHSARFAVPEIQLGVFPPVAAALLPMLAGGALTNELLLTGQKIDALRLQQAGVVSHVAATGELSQHVNDYLEKRLLPHSASSLRFAHQAGRLALVNHYQSTIGVLEKLYLDELMSTADANEGIASFIEKRAPQWQGK